MKNCPVILDFVIHEPETGIPDLLIRAFYRGHVIGLGLKFGILQEVADNVAIIHMCHLIPSFGVGLSLLLLLGGNSRFVQDRVELVDMALAHINHVPAEIS